MGVEMIQFSRPLLGQKEVAAVREAILSGWVTQGPKVNEFEGAFAAYTGAKYSCAVSNCTAALHLALLAVGVGSGDAVITVSHSFIATANSIRNCGAEPVFIDIDLDTYNMSPQALEKCLLKDCKFRNKELKHELGRIAAILLVHQMGMPCDLEAILALARRFSIPVVEDAACAIGSEIKINGRWDKIGKPHGDIACFSFHPRKVITTGEGGMITTNNRVYSDKFRLLRHHGMSVTDRQRHLMKKVFFEKYLMVGYNYRLSDIQAAIGIEQLKRLPELLKERRKIARLYEKELKSLKGVETPYVAQHCNPNWQSYPVRLSGILSRRRNKLMQLLLDKGISTRRGIMNAHQEKPYLSSLRLPFSELARDSVMLLPFYNTLRESLIVRVVKAIREQLSEA